jgi:hypothetical protein
MVTFNVKLQLSEFCFHFSGLSEITTTSATAGVEPVAGRYIVTHKNFYV